METNGAKGRVEKEKGLFPVKAALWNSSVEIGLQMNCIAGEYKHKYPNDKDLLQHGKPPRDLGFK